MSSTRAAKAAAAMVERFAEMVTEAACRASGKSLHYSAPNEAGFTHFYCSLKGHAFNGAPAAWVHATPGGELEASCPKCVPSRFATPDSYLAALTAAIGWDPAGDVLHANFGGRRHVYRTFDDRYELIHAKLPAADARSDPNWTLRFRELLPDGKYGRTWWPNKLMPAAYPTRQHYYNVVRPYRAERILERPPSCTIVICEGEKDCDSFNELADVIGNRALTATCLPHPRPTELEDHQIELLQGREVILVPDADSTGEGNAAAWGTCLREVAKTIKVLRPELLGLVHGDKTRNDLTDAITVRKDSGESLAQVAAWLLEVIAGLEPAGDDAFAARDSWFARLDRSATTKAIKDTISNARIALTEHPELRGRWRFNVRSGEIEAIEPPWTEAPVVTGRRAIAAAVADWLGSDSRKLALKVATYSDALGLAKVSPPYDPLAPLCGNAWDGTPRLDTLFTDLIPLELERTEAIALARVVMADLGAKLLGELRAQRAIVCIATDESYDLAGAMLGDHGRLYGGATVRERELAAFVRAEAALVQIGMGPVADRQAARVSTTQVFCDRVVTHDRQISTPYFIALGPEPDPRTVRGLDERSLLIPLRAAPLTDALQAQFPQLLAEALARRVEIAATTLPTKQQLASLDSQASQDDLRPMLEAIYLYATRRLEDSYATPFMLRRAPLRAEPLFAIDRERLLELAHLLLFDDWRGQRDRESAFNATCRQLGWVKRGTAPKLTLRRSQAEALGIEFPARRGHVTRPGVRLTPDRIAQLEAILYPPEGPEGGELDSDPLRGSESVSRVPVDWDTDRDTANSIETAGEYTSGEGVCPCVPQGMASRGSGLHVQTSRAHTSRDNLSKGNTGHGYLEGAAAIAAAQAILAGPGACVIDFESHPADAGWHADAAAAAAPRGQKGAARDQARRAAELNGRAHLRRPCVLSLAHSSGAAVVVRLAAGDDWRERRAELAAMFAECQADLVAHRAQFETELLLQHGVALDIECTWLMAKALLAVAFDDEKQAPPVEFSLAALVERELGRVRDKTIRDRDWRLAESLDETAVEYCRQDARDALELFQLYRARLERDGLLEGYRLIQQAILPTAAVNLAGVEFDAAAHRALTEHLRRRAARLKRLLDQICGGAVRNHGSPRQVSSWIIEQVLEGDYADDPNRIGNFAARLCARTGTTWKQTKARHLAITKSIKARQARALEPCYPTVARYLRAHALHTQVTKLADSFGEPLERWVDADGRLRGQMTAGATVTLRHNAQHPPTQEMPRRKSFRRLFRAPEGRRLVDCDYAQIELRLAAIEAHDEALLEVYRGGLDVHAAVARNVDLPRQQAKPVSFTMIYGGGASKVAESAGVSPEKGQAVLEGFLRAYPGIARYRERAPLEAQETGFIAIRPGRRVRYDPAISKPAQAVNYPIQGGAASVQMLALRKVYDALEAQPWLDAQVVASVHDELLLEAPDDERAEIAAGILQHEMRAALLAVYPEALEMGAARLAEAEVLTTWAEKS